MCFGSSSAPEEETATSQLSNTIDKQIKQEERKAQSQVKLLLLGSCSQASFPKLGWN